MTRTLLVIDDDEASCRLVQAVFAAEGHQVLAAHDAETGLAKIQSIRPDLVFLDITLPDSDGFSVLEKLSTSAYIPPVIMLTAHRRVKNAVRAMQLGAFEYLTKPID